MPHITKRTVEARLAAWKTFFQTGQGAPADVEYGDDPLVDMAFRSPSLELQDLAVEVESALEQSLPRSTRVGRVTLKDINAVLANSTAFETLAAASEPLPPLRGRRAVSVRELRAALVG